VVACQHLVHERAQRPPVDRLAVRHALQNLGRQVLRCAAECARPVVLACHALLRDTKVSHADVTVIGEQKILGLEIAVYDTHVVEILEAQGNLADVELGAWLGELLLLLKMREQLTAVDEVHDEA